MTGRTLQPLSQVLIGGELLRRCRCHGAGCKSNLCSEG
jgi:hypothetical protein